MLVTSRIVGLALAVGLVAAVGPVRGQDRSEGQQNAREQAHAEQTKGPTVRRVVPVQHQDVVRLAALARSFAQTRYDQALRVIILSGAEAAVDEAEKMIRELDQPREGDHASRLENVELTIHLIAGVDHQGDRFADSPLGPVVEQLRSRFSHAGYRLLDSLALRGRDGRTLRLSGALPGSIENDASRVEYDVQTEAVAVFEEGSYRVSCRSFEVSMQRMTPGSGSANRARIETRLTVPTDKLVVVGKTGVDDPLMEGLFVVLSARVVE